MRVMDDTMIASLVPRLQRIRVMYIQDQLIFNTQVQ
jgi:hypothetical protein